LHTSGNINKKQGVKETLQFKAKDSVLIELFLPYEAKPLRLRFVEGLLDLRNWLVVANLIQKEKLLTTKTANH
jgi:hypothetical protein